MLLLDTAAVPVGDRIEVFNAAMLEASVPMAITHEDPGHPIHARMHLCTWGQASCSPATTAASGSTALGGT